MNVSMAATTIAAAASSSSTSLPLRNKLLHLPSDYNQSLTSHFTSKPKPTKPLKLRSQKPRTPPFSLLFPSLLRCASATFDDFVSEDDEPESEAEDDDYEEGDMESVDAGRLYVGNLPYSMTATELTEVFSEAGRVVSVQIVYDRVTDRSRGFAFVTMGSFAEATQAIRMYDGSQVGGRTVKVNFPEVPRGGERDAMAPRIRRSNQGFVDSPHALYVGNLSWAITSQGLKEAFLDQPGLLSAKVIYDRDTGRSRGFGFVTFSSAEEMESAVIAMNGVELEERPLRVNIAEDRTPTQAQNSEDSFGNRDMLSSFSN